MNIKTTAMDANEMNRALKRIAHEIVEDNKGLENLALVGIRRRGVPLAQRLASLIKEFEGVDLPVGILDITLFRDDLNIRSDHPIVRGSDILFTISGKNLVMVDDVLYSGRTVRAGIEALMGLGRPEKIRLAVLVDRGHREIPIQADFVGKKLPTSKGESVAVHLTEMDGEDKVLIMG